MRSTIALGLAALTLTACDAVSDVAGQAIGEQVRSSFVERCEQTVGDTGLASSQVTVACNCAADELSARLGDGDQPINREIIEQVALACADGGTPETTEIEPVGG
ncbi:MAG: hypothetical protein WA918_12670 [Erythrobacter sp.]